jgi:competence protein ComEA
MQDLSKLRRFAVSAGFLAAALTVAAAPPATPPAGPPQRPAAAKPTAQNVVNVNTATIADLMTVPGIGKALAERIVDFREKNGPFDQVGDLVKVRGIGEKSLAKLQPYLTVSPAR